MLTDKDIMKFGKHRGVALANVPASYLLYIYDFSYISPALRDYIRRNMDVLKAEDARARREERR